MYKDPAFIVPLSRIAIIMFHGNWAMIEWCRERSLRGTSVYTDTWLKCTRNSKCLDCSVWRPVSNNLDIAEPLINRLFIDEYWRFVFWQISLKFFNENWIYYDPVRVLILVSIFMKFACVSLHSQAIRSLKEIIKFTVIAYQGRF